MDLGKRFKKSNNVVDVNDTNFDTEMAKIKEQYEAQMNAVKEKQKKQQEQLRIQKELEEKERKQREIDAQIEREKKLLEDEKLHKEFMEKQLERIKEQERLYQNSIKIKEKPKGHPEGCFCAECKGLEIKESGFLPKKENIKKSFLLKNTFSKITKTNKNKKQKNKIDLAKSEPKENIGTVNTNIKPSIFTDITVLGIRLAVGFTFIFHGLSKFNEDGFEFGSLLQQWGLPSELSIPIAYIELLSGVFITIGLLTRLASLAIAIIMLGAIFIVKKASTLIGVGGFELDVIILSSMALLGIFGPGRLSVANKSIKGLLFARFLH